MLSKHEAILVCICKQTFVRIEQLHRKFHAMFDFNNGGYRHLGFQNCLLLTLSMHEGSWLEITGEISLTSEVACVFLFSSWGLWISRHGIWWTLVLQRGCCLTSNQTFSCHSVISEVWADFRFSRWWLPPCCISQNSLFKLSSCIFYKVAKFPENLSLTSLCASS